MNMSEVSEDIAVPTLTKRQVSLMKYRLAHKESLRIYRRQYRESHLEEEKQYQREYYVTYKDKRNEGTRDYYIDNKDTIKGKQAEKFKCECGGKYTRSNKLQHERQNIHIRSLEINEIIK